VCVSVCGCIWVRGGAQGCILKPKPSKVRAPLAWLQGRLDRSEGTVLLCRWQGAGENSDEALYSEEKKTMHLRALFTVSIFST